MRIKKIEVIECELIHIEGSYFNAYCRGPNKCWYHKLNNDWIECGMVDDYEEEYERFKQAEQIADRRTAG